MIDAKGHLCLSVEIINALNLLFFPLFNMQDTAGWLRVYSISYAKRLTEYCFSYSALITILAEHPM